MIEVLLILLFALILPLILIPVEKIFPYPHIVEELTKLVLVLKIYQIEKQLNKNLSFFVILSGLLFTLSESIFYLINIFTLGDLTMIPKRLFFTGILHIGTLMLIYIFGRKNNVGLLIILLFSIVIHYLYNQWAGNFF
ncbi:hypothetical protein COY15_00525 [Candidatus Roizmanbacteria bacterium CG_4_10_14_0_2_um_filter_39_12]|nr:MAG: hypothetical protein COY15_00525 [Candidatus Roizmanbacteria bacterium CG_4_10_14_0_2_um_filter_39_12]